MGRTSKTWKPMISFIELILSESEALICEQTWLKLKCWKPDFILSNRHFIKFGEVDFFVKNSHMHSFCFEPFVYSRFCFTFIVRINFQSCVCALEKFIDEEGMIQFFNSAISCTLYENGWIFNT